MSSRHWGAVCAAILSIGFTQGFAHAESPATGAEALTRLDAEYAIRMEPLPARWETIRCWFKDPSRVQLCRADDSREAAHLALAFLPTSKVTDKLGALQSARRMTFPPAWKNHLVNSEAHQQLRLGEGRPADLHEYRVYWTGSNFNPYVSILTFETDKGYSVFLVLYNGGEARTKPVPHKDDALEIAKLFR